MHQSRFELPFYQPTGALRVSGRRDKEDNFLVFLEVARTLPGMVKMIPKEGGRKYDWDHKVTFHLDLIDISNLSFYLSDAAPPLPFIFYRNTLDRREKKLEIILGENGRRILKVVQDQREILLTLNASDIFLLTQGLMSLIEEMIWKPVQG